MKNKTVSDIKECKDNQEIIKERFGKFKGSMPQAQDILDEVIETNKSIVYNI